MTAPEDMAASKRDFAADIEGAGTEDGKAGLTADWILAEFDAYYRESRQIPERAQRAFEGRDHNESLALSKRRLFFYSSAIRDLGAQLATAFPRLAEDERLWQAVEERYLPMIEGRYEADLAFAFINSIRRKIYHGEWKPEEYSFGTALSSSADVTPKVYRSFPGGSQVSAEAVAEILVIPNFKVPFQDLGEDAYLTAERANENLGLDGRTPDAIRMIEMIDAGFFRNRGAYLVGRIEHKSGDISPFIISLEIDEDGVFVDAVLTSEADTHNLFSSTLANFNVTSPLYHELSAFLHSIMPRRPLGLHYSTVGFNHVGKVAVMNDLRGELATHGEVFDTAVGFRGTVAIGFAAPSSRYALKVIRDHPTAGYKWDTFDGVDAVLRKYGQVHEINRTGSMLDNIIFYNLKLDQDWFAPALLDELLAEAGENVSVQDGAVAFKHLIVQMKMIPLPVFFESASEDDVEAAIINLGHCIKNNAAANIFNKDLDARNYGVGAFHKVFLFDYDALEPFGEIKIRTNMGRFDGEEDPPDWVFEDGVVFLPEEMEPGLRIPNRALSRLFRQVHGDLMSVEYWERMQRELGEGQVPSIRVYPEDRKIRREINRLGMYY